METYTPANSINKDNTIKRIENYEINRLRKANSNYKLQIIDLKQKLKEIHSLLTNEKKPKTIIY